MSDTRPMMSAPTPPATLTDTAVLPPSPPKVAYAYSALPAELSQVKLPLAGPSLSKSPFTESPFGELPLPSVGDFWGLQHPDSVARHVAPVRMPRPLAPSWPVYLRPRTAPVVSWAFTCALTSVPLLLLFGAGAILGVLAIVLGVVGIGQANSSPRYRGTVRAGVSIAIGASTAIVGTPIMLLTMAVFNAL